MDIKYNKRTIFDILVAIKGGGDLASGVAFRLYNSNIRNIFLMEVKKPLAVRRLVSFSEAVYKGETTIEGVTAVLAKSIDDIQKIMKRKKIPVIIDPLWGTSKIKSPDVMIDAIMAKKNTGTRVSDASLVIGLGPGFEVGYDTDLVIETKRGHNLGKVLYSGSAEENTSVPEEVNGFTYERVLRSPADGFFESKHKIGDMVGRGEIIGQVGGRPVPAEITGILRGLIRSGMKVTKNMKIADVDPRGKAAFCYSISDKARALGGAALEAIFGNHRLLVG